MKYMLHVRGRPEDMPTLERHEALLACLDKTDWFVASRAAPLEIEESMQSSECSLTRAFTTRVTAFARYFNLDCAEDYGRCDDFFDIEFDPTKVDYDFVVDDVFPEVVRCFQAYRGMIAHQDECVSRKGFSEFRNTVEQLDLADYFDRKLCKRAFDLTPRQIALGLKGHVADVSHTRQGVSIVATREILGPRKARTLGQSLLKNL